MKDNPNSKSIIQNRFVATGITVGVGAALTFSGQTMSIWPVFGSANQLLAALALLALTAWVAYIKKGTKFVMIPMLFMFAVTLTSLAMLAITNFNSAHYLLSVISLLLFLLAVSLGVKTYNVLIKNHS
jgi:carbon starvation protein